MSVSLCLMVRNEAEALPGCLQSVAGIANEIIVVDTGSTDRTKEVAKGFGAKVFDFPWCDDFAAARNECIRHATGEWIFWLDADERIDETNRHKLKALFESLGRSSPPTPTLPHRGGGRRFVGTVFSFVLNACPDRKHHNHEPTGGNKENGEPTERGVPSLFSLFSPVLDFFASWSICSRQKSRSAAHERPPWARNQEPQRSWGESNLV